MHEQVFLNGAPVVGFGDADLSVGNPIVWKPFVGYLVGSIGGAVAGSFIKKGVGTAVGAIGGGLGGIIAGAALYLRGERAAVAERKAGDAEREIPVTLPNPNYPIKYTAQALQLAALPSTQGPVMLCSYIPFATLESTKLDAAQAQLQRLKGEHETAPEDLYGRKGRRQIIRLLKRYFDPKTFAELPSDTLYESDQKFLVPTSPDSGVPCG